jgi:hypothetical protein
MGTHVIALDIGSVRPPSKFAWTTFDAPGRNLINTGEDPEEAVWVLASALRAGTQTALLLEAPMAVPVPGGDLDAWRSWERPATGRATGHGRQEPGPERWRPGSRRGLGCFASSPSPFPGWWRRHSPDLGGAEPPSCC